MLAGCVAIYTQHRTTGTCFLKPRNGGINHEKLLQALQKLLKTFYFSYICEVKRKQFVMPDIQIQSDSLRFRPTLPFEPQRKQVIYVEDRYHAHLNDFLTSNYNQINEALSEFGYEFCYFPMLSLRFTSKEFVQYFTPYRNNFQPQQIDSSCLEPYLVRGLKMEAAFLVYNRQIRNYHVFHAFKPTGSEHNLEAWIEAFIAYLKEFASRQIEERYYGCSSGSILSDQEDDFADRQFSLEVLNLMKDVREKVARLRQYGVNEMVLSTLLNPQIKLSSLRITANGDIVLPGYDNREIKMSPLVKSVYFLFLRHPEGIAFKMLPDYRSELYDIYVRLTGRSSVEGIEQSIADLTNPIKNSINEKCARIREAFVREFDDRLAQYYYVTGSRGMPKGVQLPQNMVVWEWSI